jgi:hypothetical protein
LDETASTPDFCRQIDIHRVIHEVGIIITDNCSDDALSQFLPTIFNRNGITVDLNETMYDIAIDILCNKYYDA